MKSLGIDIGSSFVKVSLLDIESGRCLSSSTNPSKEMPITCFNPGWAEQDPLMWWRYVCDGIRKLKLEYSFDDLKCIGITYQMHGLVCLDKDGRLVRDAIIWCDSRAAEIGKEALYQIGEQKCLERLLNSPGNFTASKLYWVKTHEPKNFQKISKFILPGDYIAYMLSNTINTTETGLSEQILWDFKENRFADFLAEHYGIPEEIVPDIVPSIGVQAYTSRMVEELLGIKEGTPISYRAGDQPNNAFSLNVLHPGEIAATGGTSGVVYGVTDQLKYDQQSRVNSFVHVNHEVNHPSIGILLCINGTGIMNSWIRRNVTPSMGYAEMNELAASVPVGSEGVIVLPFGNGVERVLENRYTGASILGLDLNRHSSAHILRAAQEGIAYSFKYGIDIMRNLGLEAKVIRAGKANLFLSPVFRQTLSDVTGASIELYDTDGALGAARGAVLGTGIYRDAEEAFSSLNKLEVTIPYDNNHTILSAGYENWRTVVEKLLEK